MLDFLKETFGGSFMPHGHCYLWREDLLFLHAGSDALTALAYYAIPLILIYFVYHRRDLAFKWMFVLFGAFILSCGTVHLLEIWSIWHGAYYLTGSVKLVTGVVSITTAVLLVPLVPKALALPSPSQLAASEARYRSVIASMAEGVLIAGPDGIITSCNDSAARILACSRDDLLGRPVESIRPPVVNRSGTPVALEAMPSQQVLRSGAFGPCPPTRTFRPSR